MNGAGGAGYKTEVSALDSSVRAAAAHVLGTAAANNLKFQSQLIKAHPGIFHELIKARKRNLRCEMSLSFVLKGRCG